MNSSFNVDFVWCWSVSVLGPLPCPSSKSGEMEAADVERWWILGQGQGANYPEISILTAERFEVIRRLEHRVCSAPLSLRPTNRASHQLATKQCSFAGPLVQSIAAAALQPAAAASNTAIHTGPFRHPLPPEPKSRSPSMARRSVSNKAQPSSRPANWPASKSPG